MKIKSNIFNQDIFFSYLMNNTQINNQRYNQVRQLAAQEICNRDQQFQYQQQFCYNKMQPRYNNKENKTSEVLPVNRSIKKKNNHQKSIGCFKKGKRKEQIYNLQKFMHNLKTQNLKTERFNSPYKHKYIYEVLQKSKRQNSSKSRQINKSIQSMLIYDQASRQKSGDTYKKTQRTKIVNNNNQSKSKNKASKLNRCLSILSIPSNNLQFREFTLQMCDRIQQVQNFLKSKIKQQNQDIGYSITKKFRELFSSLIKIMIKQINDLFDHKQQQIINSIENITTLQNDIIQKQTIMQKLEYQKKTLREQLSYADKIIQKQNKYILQIKQKQSRISKLLYTLRKKGIDIDQIYTNQLQTPLQQTSEQSSLQKNNQLIEENQQHSEIVENLNRNNSY